MIDKSNKVCLSLSMMNNPIAHINIRFVPRETLQHLKLMAAIERTSVKSLVLGLIHAKIEQLEKQGHKIR